MIDMFEQALQLMADIHSKKNSDYGNSFDDTCNKFGMVAALVRMYDKLNRLSTLSKIDYIAKVDESIEDTLIDLANYAILTYCWLKTQNNGIRNTQHDDVPEAAQVVDEADQLHSKVSSSRYTPAIL